MGVRRSWAATSSSDPVISACTRIGCGRLRIVSYPPRASVLFGFAHEASCFSSLLLRFSSPPSLIPIRSLVLLHPYPYAFFGGTMYRCGYRGPPRTRGRPTSLLFETTASPLITTTTTTTAHCRDTRVQQSLSRRPDRGVRAPTTHTRLSFVHRQRP